MDTATWVSAAALSVSAVTLAVARAQLQVGRTSTPGAGVRVGLSDMRLPVKVGDVWYRRFRLRVTAAGPAVLHDVRLKVWDAEVFADMNGEIMKADSEVSVPGPITSSSEPQDWTFLIKDTEFATASAGVLWNAKHGEGVFTRAVRRSLTGSDLYRWQWSTSARLWARTWHRFLTEERRAEVLEYWVGEDPETGLRGYGRFRYRGHWKRVGDVPLLPGHGPSGSAPFPPVPWRQRIRIRYRRRADR